MSSASQRDTSSPTVKSPETPLPTITVEVKVEPPKEPDIISTAEPKGMSKYQATVETDSDSTPLPRIAADKASMPSSFIKVELTTDDEEAEPTTPAKAPNMSGKRKRDASSAPAPRLAKSAKTATASSPGRGKLIPIDDNGNFITIADRKLARLNDDDDENTRADNRKFLSMKCKHSTTGKVKELQFQGLGISRNEIDFTNIKHLGAINAWRNQIFGRGGLGIKDVTTWHNEEVMWFDLYYNLLIAKAKKDGKGFSEATMKSQCDSFNGLFAGKLLKGKHGQDLPPRKKREYASFVAKHNRTCKELKDELNRELKGKSGDVFKPEITANMLAQFINGRKKQEHGIEDDEESWDNFMRTLLSESVGDETTSADAKEQSEPESAASINQPEKKDSTADPARSEEANDKQESVEVELTEAARE